MTEEQKKYMKQWKEKHPGYFDAYGKNYYTNNKKSIAIKYKKYSQTHKIKIRKLRRAYYDIPENRQKMIDRAKKAYRDKLNKKIPTDIPTQSSNR